MLLVSVGVGVLLGLLVSVVPPVLVPPVPVLVPPVPVLVPPVPVLVPPVPVLVPPVPVLVPPVPVAGSLLQSTGASVPAVPVADRYRGRFARIRT